MRRMALTAVVLAAGVGPATADEGKVHEVRPVRDFLVKKFARVTTPDDDYTHKYPSTATASPHQAGNPYVVKPHAQPVDHPYFTGGYSGGGRTLFFWRKADGRDIYQDGTWGWDYVGIAHRRPGHVFQDWWHDRPKQPQPGTYRTEGPEVPDPIGGHPLLKAATGHEEEKE